MKVAVSWSGGLESSLACHKAIAKGHDVACLVTFVLDEYWPAMGHPPRAHFKPEYTKSGVGERTVFFSYETRDALKDWLNIKDSMKKRAGKGSYAGEKVFPVLNTAVHNMFFTALTKAKLDQRDKNTNRLIYHIHGLRKFFRTKIGLPLDTVNALMGHSEYLDESYLRQDPEEIAKEHLKG